MEQTRSGVNQLPNGLKKHPPIPTTYPEAYLEKLHGWSHALGVVLAIAGTVILLYLSEEPGPYQIPSLLVYSLSVLFLFAASTSYHLAREEGLKSKLRIVDHIGIYLLIAGTYTPVCVMLLGNSRGWLLLGIVWAIAFGGTVLKLLFPTRWHTLALVLYLLMGWLIALDFTYLLNHTSTAGISLLAGGGAAYTIGIVFYIWEKLPFNHLIWHGFVLAGAVSHWFFIALEVAG